MLRNARGALPLERVRVCETTAVYTSIRPNAATMAFWCVYCTPE